MAKTFLTNINLKGNQLLNAVIQSASSAPTAYAAGQLYFNTTDSLFYYSTGAGTGNWEPVGVQYITSVGSNLSVNNGQLSISSTPSFDKVLATNNGNGTNVKIGDDGWLGDVNLANTINIMGVEDDNQGYISFGQNGALIDNTGRINNYIGSNGTDLTVGSTNDIVLKPGSNYVYIGSQQLDGSNRVSTIGGTETLTNKTIGDELHFTNGGNDGFIAGQSGTLVINSNNGLSTTSDGDTTITTTIGNIVLNPDGGAYVGDASTESHRIVTRGDIGTLELHIEGTPNQITIATDPNNGYDQISLPSYIVIPNGEVHIRKTEYWENGDSGTQYGVVTANPYSGHFNVVSVGRDLELESQNGYNIILNSSGGYIDATSAEIHSKKTEYWLDGQNRGALLAHPSDGSLTLAATGWLHLESHDGNIQLDPSSGTVHITNNVSIDQYGNIGTNNTDITLNPDSGNVVVNGTLVTDNIRSNNSGNDPLYITASDLFIGNSDATIFGGPQTGTNGQIYVRNSSNITAFSVNTTELANSLPYYGYNSYTDKTPVVRLNGFLELSSEGNDPVGHIFVNSNANTTPFPTFHVEANGDLALRAGAAGENGNIILYTGETSNRGNGRVYIGWNSSNGYNNEPNEVATVGTEQTFSNKTLDSATLGTNLDANGYVINNLQNPSYASDAANKQYVDAVAQGINIHTSVDVTTTADLNADYSDGTADADDGLGIGATLRAKTNGVISIDGYTTSPTSNPGLVVGSRILVKDQNDLKQNGVYVISSLGDSNNPWVLTRADDYNNSIKDQVIAGDFVFVSFGNTQANTAWVQINEGTGTDHSIKIGTDEMYFTQFAGAGTYTANQGVKLDGNTFQLNPKSDGGLATDLTYAYIKLRTDSGLSTTSNGLAVNPGTGILVSGANVSVDETVIATRSYADTVAGNAQTNAEGYTDAQIAAQSYAVEIDGDGTKTSFPITHNLGTRDVVVRIYQVSAGPDVQYAEVETDVVHTDLNTVTLGFASAPTNTTSYRVVVVK